MFLEPSVGRAVVDLAELVTEGRNAHAEHSGEFLHTVRPVAVAVHLHPEHGGIQRLQPFLGKLEIQLGKRCVLPADLFAPFHEEVVAYLITHVVQGLWSAGMVQHLAQIEHLRRAVRFPVRLDEMVQQVVLYLHLFGEGEQHQQWPVLFA